MSVANLMVAIGGNASGLISAMSQAQSSLAALEDHSNKVTAAIAAAGAAFVAFGATGMHGLIGIERFNTQTQAAIRSTGEAAGVSTQDILDLSGSLEVLTGVEAEAIQIGQNMLLTFTNIRNVVGEGNDIFDQATRAITDMATAMGSDNREGLKGAALQVGKALNDPVNGMAALQRVGVAFTAAQKDLVKGLVESGNVLGAQKIILHELQGEFGGSAEAAGNTFYGALRKALNAVGDLNEAVAAPLFEPFKNALYVMQDLLIRSAVYVMEKGLGQALIDLIAPTEAAKTAVLMFAGAIVAMMIPSIVAAITSIATFIAAMGPYAAAGAAVAFTAYQIYRAWQVVPGVIGAVMANITSMSERVSAAITYYFRAAVKYVADLFGILPSSIHSALSNVYQVARNYLGEKLGGLLDWVSKKWSAFLNLIGSGPDFVAVKKMIVGIGRDLAAPVVNAYEQISASFGKLPDRVFRPLQSVRAAVAPTFAVAADGADAVGKSSKGASEAVKALADAQKAAAQSARMMADENLALASLTEAQRAQIQAAQQYGQALADNAARQALFGFSVQDTESLIRATEQAMVAFVVNGMDPASEQIAYLAQQSAELTDQLKRHQLASLGSTTESGKMADATKVNAAATKEAASALDVAEASIRGVRSVMRELSQALGEQTARWTDFGLEVADAGIGVAKAFGSGAIIGIISAALATLSLAVKGVTMAYNDATKAQREAEEAQAKAGKEALDAMRRQYDGVQQLGYAYTELIATANEAGRALTLDELGAQFDKATEKMIELRMEGVSPLSESYQALRAIQADIEAQFRNVANASGQTALAFRAVGKAGADAAKQVSAMIERANSAVESAGSAIGDYLAAAADEMDLSAFESSFADAIRKAVMSAVEKAVTASIVAKGTLSTLIQALQGELTAGRMGAAEALIPKIAQQAEAEARRVGPVIDRLRSAIDSAFIPGKGTIGPADIVAPIRDQAQEIKQTVNEIKRATETLAPSPAMRPGEISAYLPQGRESRQVVINVTGNTVLNDRDADRLGNALVGSMRRAGVAF